LRDWDAFNSHVALKYQIYNGLFLSLPFKDVRQPGILLPVFASYCREQLETGGSPPEIVRNFFAERTESTDSEEMVEVLFKFMQIAERQVVLFDALEDAAFPFVQDLGGTGSLKELLGRISAGNKEEEYAKLLEDFRVRVVLTAHPTQFYPDEVLAIITDLSKALRNDDLQGIYNLLLQMGKTRFKNREKPTPLDEAKSLLWYLENIFYETVPRVQRTLTEILPDSSFDHGPAGPNVELGFWPGGDRDGNPYVTADTTREVGSLLRSSVLRLYQADLKRLERRLTFEGITERIARISEKLRLTIYPLVKVSTADTEDDGACEDVSESAYQSAEELESELMSVHKELQIEHMGLFAEQLQELIVKVRTFGFHFASMDLRQDSRVHAQAVADIIEGLRRSEKGDLPFTGDDYLAMNDAARVDSLGRLLDAVSEEIDASALMPQESRSKDIIQAIRAADVIQGNNGERGLHRYVISNTHSVSDILTPFVLTHHALRMRSGIKLDIVPLFETIEDLSRAHEVMETLYGHPAYRSHLEERGNLQTIMVGFSDGTKDGGYVTANWEIFRAKERLTTVAREHGVQVIFFDGRGGPPARGGGNTHKFYRSFGKTIESREIHLTVQGQTISSKYGTEEAARHNLEQLVSAGLENNLFPHSSDLQPEDVEFLDNFSQTCRKSYQELREHPQFMPYLKEMTPLVYYGQTNIASRPTSRGNTDELTLSDLRAIPFVGAWSQLKQNIPGFFGFGSGIAQAIEEKKADELKQLYQRSLFFRTLVENAMQSLSKTYYPLTAFMGKDRKFGDFWHILSDEAERTRRSLVDISGQSDILASEPTIKESIRLREDIILPVQVIQQYALARLREAKLSEEDRSTCEKMVIKSLAASVNASRNAV